MPQLHSHKMHAVECHGLGALIGFSLLGAGESPRKDFSKAGCSGLTEG